MRNKLLLIGIGILLLILIVIFIFFNPLANKQNTTQNVQPTTTATSLQYVHFSGFNSNIALSYQSLSSVSSVSLPQTRMTVYEAAPLDVTYLSSLWGLSKNPALGILQNNTLYLQPLPDNSLNIIFKTGTPESVNENIALSIVKSFLVKDLNMDIGSVSLSISKVSNGYLVSGTQQINNVPVVSLDSHPAFTAQVSSNGKLVSIRIYKMYHNVSAIGDYPLSVTSLTSNFSSYTVGLYTTSNIQSITNTSLTYSNYGLAYYYDLQTGNIVPVLRLNCTAGDGVSNYPLTMLALLLSPGIVTQDIPTPTSQTLNGYNPF